MPNKYAISRPIQSQMKPSPISLAAEITRSESRQSYAIIHFLVDRDRVPEAYQAYGYFRWLDDYLDAEVDQRSQRIAFVDRQRTIMDNCYRGVWPTQITPKENMLVNLIQRDVEENSGLQSYIRNMMAVMIFDAKRRGSLISQEELTAYSWHLATAVTDALHYFIGHECSSPPIETRHFAAMAAHITHTLRDTFEDIQSGYYNVPREYLMSHGINPWDISTDAYREWVKRRVKLARAYFKAGREYLAKIENFRCRIAGFSYIGRFEPILDAIERENYFLRSDYSEFKSLGAGLKLCLSTLSQACNHRYARRTSPSQMVEEG